MGAMMFWFFKRADTHEQDQPFYYFRMFDPNFTPHPVYDALKAYIPAARFLGVGFHQEDHWALDYTGAWETHADDHAAGGSYKIGQPGATLSFTFDGTELALALLQNPYSGSVDVSIDGGPAREIDLRATDPEASGQVALAHALRPGTHRAQLTVARGRLFLDGVVVWQTNDWLAKLLVWPAALLLILAALVLRGRIVARRQRASRRQLRARVGL